MGLEGLFCVFLFTFVRHILSESIYSVDPTFLVTMSSKLKDTSHFSFVKPGYLYNPMNKTFMAINRGETSEYKDMQLYMTKTPSKALKLKIVKLVDPATEKPLTVIASMEDPLDSEKVVGDLQSKVITSSGQDIFLKDFDFSPTQTVVIVPEIGGDPPLFVMYLKNNCISAGYRNNLLYELHYSIENSNYWKQLWMWIDQDRFKKDVVNDVVPDYLKKDSDNKEAMKNIIEYYKNHLKKEKEDEVKRGEEEKQRTKKEEELKKREEEVKKREESLSKNISSRNRPSRSFLSFDTFSSPPKYGFKPSVDRTEEIYNIFSDPDRLKALRSSNYGKNLDLVFGQSHQCQGSSVMIGYCI